jgi:predicted porin
MAVKFLAGMSDNDRDLRVLNNTVSSGQEIITDQYDSTYVTAGASWIKSKYERERFSNSQFLLSMDINHEQIEASSASAYYHLDDRDITQLVNQAQYSFTMQGMNKRLQLNGSFGLAHTRNIDGRAQTYTIDGTALSYISEKKSTYTTRSLGATYQLNPLCYAYANAKWVDNSDDINGTTGTVGLVVNF